MALRIVATQPNPALVTLPWHLSLDEWERRHRGAAAPRLSRHIVRIVRLGEDVYAVKQTREHFANGSTGCCATCAASACRPSSRWASSVGESTRGRGDRARAWSPVTCSTRCPTGLSSATASRTTACRRSVDALVVLLVRLHLSGFCWGDVSLSNVLFRRSAGEFAAYLVDAETGELHETLSHGQRAQRPRRGDDQHLRRAARPAVGRAAREDVWRRTRSSSALQERYDGLWAELTGTEEFTTDEIWRIEQSHPAAQRARLRRRRAGHRHRLGRLDRALRPRSWRPNHHQRELQG